MVRTDNHQRDRDIFVHPAHAGTAEDLEAVIDDALAGLGHGGPIAPRAAARAAFGARDRRPSSSTSPWHLQTTTTTKKRRRRTTSLSASARGGGGGTRSAPRRPPGPAPAAAHPSLSVATMRAQARERREAEGLCQRFVFWFIFGKFRLGDQRNCSDDGRPTPKPDLPKEGTTACPKTGVDGAVGGFEGLLGGPMTRMRCTARPSRPCAMSNPRPSPSSSASGLTRAPRN